MKGIFSNSTFLRLKGVSDDNTIQHSFEGILFPIDLWFKEVTLSNVWWVELSNIDLIVRSVVKSGIGLVNLMIGFRLGIELHGNTKGIGPIKGILLMLIFIHIIII